MEKKKNILLLDYSRSSGLAAAVKEILLSSDDFFTKIYIESMSGFGYESIEFVKGFTSRYDPDIIIITGYVSNYEPNTVFGGSGRR